jgi:hypothetical protein
MFAKCPEVVSMAHAAIICDATYLEPVLVGDVAETVGINESESDGESEHFSGSRVLRLEGASAHQNVR